MSDSDEDFFVSTQLPTKKKESVSVFTAPYKQSVVEYFFLVTFNWDLMVANPFQLNVCEKIIEFPEAWIKGPLNKENRLLKQPINALGGGQHSLFCKVQKGISIYRYIYSYFNSNCNKDTSILGTSCKLRNDMIRNLNLVYEKHIQAFSKQDMAYRKMVDTHPPRFLSGYTYGEDPQPLRSQRIAVLPIETDVNYIYIFLILLLLWLAILYYFWVFKYPFFSFFLLLLYVLIRQQTTRNLKVMPNFGRTCLMLRLKPM